MFGNRKLMEARAEAEKWKDRAIKGESHLKCWIEHWVKVSNENECFCDRLHRIIAEEKPTSNATVRRMARIARGEV